MREDFIVLVIVGLVCGFVDCSLGMGYGVTSATVLVSFDIAPAVASASVHAAEVFVDSKSAVSHLEIWHGFDIPSSFAHKVCLWSYDSALCRRSGGS